MKAFRAGICAALAVVVGVDQESLWREIVATEGYDVLRAEAKRQGNLRWCGFVKYPKGGAK